MKGIYYVIIVLILFGTSFYLLGQSENLPSSATFTDAVYQFEDTEAKMIQVKITKDYEVFIEGGKLEYWNDFETVIMNIALNWESEKYILSNFMISCDRSVNYSFVDKVKEELARSGKRIFFLQIQL